MLLALMIGCSVSDEDYCETFENCYETYAGSPTLGCSEDEGSKVAIDYCKENVEVKSIKEASCEERWELHKECVATFPEDYVQSQTEMNQFGWPECLYAFWCCDYATGFGTFLVSGSNNSILYSESWESECLDVSPEMMEKYKDYKPQPQEE